MRTFILASLTAMAVLTGSAALAQPYNGPDRDIHERQDRVGDRIQRNVETGRIDPGQGDRAVDELRDIRAQEDVMRDRRDGRLSQRDRERLQQRLAELDRRIDDMQDTRRYSGSSAPPPAPGLFDGFFGR